MKKVTPLEDPQAFERLLKVFVALTGFCAIGGDKIKQTTRNAKAFLKFYHNLETKSEEIGAVEIPANDLADLALFMVEQNLYLDTIQSLMALAFGPDAMLELAGKYDPEISRDDVVSAREYVKTFINKKEKKEEE